MKEFLESIIFIGFFISMIACGCLSAIICLWAEEEGKISGNMFSIIYLLLIGLFMGITAFLYERFVIRPFRNQWK